MFSSASEECRRLLTTVLDDQKFPAETDIVRRGDAAKSMFFLVHGIVDVIGTLSERDVRTHSVLS